MFHFLRISPLLPPRYQYILWNHTYEQEVIHNSCFIYSHTHLLQNYCCPSLQYIPNVDTELQNSRSDLKTKNTPNKKPTNIKNLQRKRKTNQIQNPSQPKNYQHNAQNLQQHAENMPYFIGEILNWAKSLEIKMPLKSYLHLPFILILIH